MVPLHWSWNVDGLGHRLNYPKNVSGGPGKRSRHPKESERGNNCWGNKRLITEAPLVFFDVLGVDDFGGHLVA